MEILETIPVYEHSEVCTIVGIILLTLSSLGLILSTIGYACDCLSMKIYLLLAIVLGIVVMFSFCLMKLDTGFCVTYSHDEYVVRLQDNYPANKFNEEYEITKKFEYSDVIQVKKRD